MVIVERIKLKQYNKIINIIRQEKMKKANKNMKIKCDCQNKLFKINLFFILIEIYVNLLNKNLKNCFIEISDKYKNEKNRFYIS